MHNIAIYPQLAKFLFTLIHVCDISDVATLIGSNMLGYLEFMLRRCKNASVRTIDFKPLCPLFTYKAGLYPERHYLCYRLVLYFCRWYSKLSERTHTDTDDGAEIKHATKRTSPYPRPLRSGQIPRATTCHNHSNKRS